MEQSEIFFDEIKEIVGGNSFFSPAGKPEIFSMMGQESAAAALPNDDGQLSKIVEAANAHGAKLLPWGAGTKVAKGSNLDSADLIVSLANLSEIKEFDHQNLSVTVGAGASLKTLEKVLAHKNLFLPLDPFYSNSLTVGGVLASNSTGPLRFKYGSVRDLVLGMRGVLPTGERIKFGGKVVKNVAGYDMTKLFIGSWGTLGFITEATFKLYPKAESEGTIIVGVDEPERIGKIIEDILDSYLEPSAIELMTKGVFEKSISGTGQIAEHGFYLAVRIDSFTEAVRRVWREVVSLSGGAWSTTLEEKRSVEFWRALSNDSVMHGGGVALKVSVPISSIPGMFFKLNGLLEDSIKDFDIVSHAGSGIVYCFFAFDVPDSQKTANLINMCDDIARDYDGHLVLEAAHSDLSKILRGYDRTPRADLGVDLMRVIKQKFDPNEIMPSCFF